MSWRIGILIAFACACARGREPTPADDLIETRLKKSSGIELDKLATKYLQNDRSAARLHVVLDAYRRVSDESGELRVLRELVDRSLATDLERRRSIDLAMVHFRLTDQAARVLIADDAAWLEAQLMLEPTCSDASRLVALTEATEQFERSIAIALESCPRENDRGHWLSIRAAKTNHKFPDDACDAVVAGDTVWVKRCLESTISDWRTMFAAWVDRQAVDRLRVACGSAKATAHVLHTCVRHSVGGSICDLLERARLIEMGWVPRSTIPEVIEERYSRLFTEHGCRSIDRPE